VVHFSVGDLLRHAVENGHEDSAEIERAMVRGEPVRDAIVLQVLLEAIDPTHAPEGRSVLLEGFPCSHEQRPWVSAGSDAAVATARVARTTDRVCGAARRTAAAAP
jgi:adenylate kinase family enzyme